MTQLNALSKSKQQHLHRTLNPVQTTRWKKKVQGLFFSLGPTGHQIKTTVKIYLMTLGAHMLHNFYRMPAHCMRSQLWARMPRPASASCNSISAWVQCSCITFMSDSKGNRVPPWCRQTEKAWILWSPLSDRDLFAHVLGGQQAAELVESRDLLKGGYRKAGATLQQMSQLKQQLCREVAGMSR